MFEISSEFNQNIFSQIIQLWKITGVGNPARGDNFTSIKKSLDHGGKIFTLLNNQKVIGTCWLTHDFRRSYIHHMAIHPDYQNAGHGRKILELALEYSQELGLQAKLEVHKNNPHAQNLYKKQGFKLLDGYEVYIKRDIKKQNEE